MGLHLNKNMGSCISKINDDLDREQSEIDKQWLNDLSKKIKDVYIRGSEFTDLKWIVANYDKIVRNRNLIDLIG